MGQRRQPVDLERLRFAADVSWLPSGERARIEAPRLSLRALSIGGWVLAAVISGVAVGLIPPSRRRRGRHSNLRRRMLRSAVRRWLGEQATSVRNARALGEIPDGELVRLRGRVRTHARNAPAFCQLAITVQLGSVSHPTRYHVIHERAVDFDVVDEHDRSILIRVAGAHLIGPVIDETERDEGALPTFRHLTWPPPLDQTWPPLRSLSMGAFDLEDGARVTIYGTKDRVVDRDVRERLARQDPIRLALRSGERAPLIIVTR